MQKSVKSYFFKKKRNIYFFSLLLPAVTQTQPPLCLILKISRTKANNGPESVIVAENFRERKLINKLSTFRQQQWNVAFVSFFLFCSGTLMLQLDGFPTGDGVKVKRNKKPIVSPLFHLCVLWNIFLSCVLKKWLPVTASLRVSLPLCGCGFPLSWQRLGPLLW